MSDERALSEAQEHIKKLARRIHNQRVSLRENWETIEMRASYPRRQALQKRMLACALEQNRQRLEAERQLSATRAELAEARAAYRALINDVKAIADRMPPPNHWTPILLSLALSRENALGRYEARAPVTESASEGGLPEPPEPR